MFQVDYKYVNSVLQAMCQLDVSLESIANVSHRLNEGMARIFDFAPESCDMDIYCPVTTVVIISPDTVEQCLSGEYAVWITSKEFEQLVLFKCQHYYLAAKSNLALNLVYQQVTAPDYLTISTTGLVQESLCS